MGSDHLENVSADGRIILKWGRVVSPQPPFIAVGVKLF
jgi:hypothetical protein